MRIKFHEGQAKIFLEGVKKYNIITKGRRFGLTYGFAIDLVLRLVSNPNNVKLLWGDTITGNIIRYYRQYIKPKLEEAKLYGLLKDYYFNETYKMLEVVTNNGIKKVVDFRSADRPQNWEGFGYDVIYLNEAGIILKNAYLWDNAVAPMMLDNPKSIAFVGGAPKGQNKFCELAEIARKDKTGKWRYLKFSSYDNPLLDPNEIKALEETLPSEVAMAEIYGECVASDYQAFFDINTVERCFELPVIEPLRPVVWGVDVARHGNDKSVIAVRQGRNITSIIYLEHNSDLVNLAEQIALRYRQTSTKPVRIFIDVTGMGWGVFDVLKRLVPYGVVVPVDFGSKKGFQFVENKRTHIYHELKVVMEEGLSFSKLPDEVKKELKRQMLYTKLEYTTSGRMKIINKEKIRKQLGKSPDELDAVALCFSEPIFISDNNLVFIDDGGNVL